MIQGHPNVGDPVHLVVAHHRPGLIPSMGPKRDCSLQMACQTGTYHLYFTDRRKEVTCPRCLKSSI